MNIKGIVKSLIKKHNTNDPFQLCECLNIVLRFENLGSLLGYYDTNYRIHTIHINQNISASLQRFVCAHVLGHALMHRDANVPFLRAHTFYCTDKLERQANTFAIELLLPDEYIQDHKDITVFNLARLSGIPMGLEELKNTGRIDFYGRN